MVAGSRPGSWGRAFRMRATGGRASGGRAGCQAAIGLPTEDVERRIQLERVAVAVDVAARVAERRRREQEFLGHGNARGKLALPVEGENRGAVLVRHEDGAIASDRHAFAIETPRRLRLGAVVRVGAPAE